MTSDKPARVYKVLRPSEQKVLEQYGRFAGSEDDERDGFIHLSTREQLAGTLAKHFPGEDVHVLALETEALGDALVFEKSRNDELFPHLYGAIVQAMTRETFHAPVVDGVHQMPALDMADAAAKSIE